MINKVNIFIYNIEEISYFIDKDIINCYSIDFKDFFIGLFINSYAKDIGYRMSKIIANNALNDKIEELIDYLDVEDETFSRFMKGQYQLDHQISFKSI